MSISYFLNDLEKIKSAIQREVEDDRDAYAYSRPQALDGLSQQLLELVQDLADYARSQVEHDFAHKLETFLDDYGFSPRVDTLSQLDAKCIRIIRTVNTFGSSLLSEENELNKRLDVGDRQFGSIADGERRMAQVSDKIFIVHGHDESAIFQVKELLTKLGLEPVVLREKPNAGRTIIEKFEQNADVGFAVILMTPDDMGETLSNFENDKAQPRARQNVILELGYFSAKLGRRGICVLKAEHVEAPSDIMGLVYTPFDSPGAWRMTLAAELRHAGYEVDLNKVI